MNTFTGGRQRTTAFGSTTQAPQTPHDQSAVVPGVAAATAERDASGADQPSSTPHAAREDERAKNDNTATSDADAASAAARGEQSRAVDGTFYNLTVLDAQGLFRKHRRAVPAERTLQDYCKSGKIDGDKDSKLGWFINEPSLLSFIMARPEVAAAVAQPSETEATAPAPAVKSEEPVSPAEPVAGASDTAIENARLAGELSTKDAIIAGKDETIAKLATQVDFLQDEIIDKRRINQDLKEIMSQMLDVIESGMGKGQALGAGKSDPASGDDVITATITHDETGSEARRDDRNAHHSAA